MLQTRNCKGKKQLQSILWSDEKCHECLSTPQRFVAKNYSLLRWEVSIMWLAVAQVLSNTHVTYIDAPIFHSKATLITYFSVQIAGIAEWGTTHILWVHELQVFIGFMGWIYLSWLQQASITMHLSVSSFGSRPIVHAYLSIFASDLNKSSHGASL